MRHWGMVAMLVAAGCRRPASDLEISAFSLADSGLDAGSDANVAEEPPQLHTTGCWSAPIVLSRTWAGASVVVLANGDAQVVWLDTTSNPLRVLSQVVSRDGGVSAIEALFTTPTAPAPGREQLSVPSLHLNSEGMSTAAWSYRGDGGERYEVHVARRRMDGGWLPSESINPDPGLQLGWADVKADGEGRLFAAWTQRPADGEPGGVRVRRFSPDAGWGTPWFITPRDTVLFVEEQALHVSDEGAAAVTWEGYGPLAEPGVHATWIHGSQAEDAQFERGGRPGFSIKPDGGALMAWTGAPEVRSVRFAGGAWGPIEKFGGDAGFSIGQAAVDTFESETLLWVAGNASHSSIWIAERADGGWVEPRALEEVSAGGPRFLLQASSRRGDRLTAWTREQSMIVMHKDGGIDSIDGLSVIDPRKPPRLAVGEDGTAWIIATAQEPAFREVALFCPSPVRP